MVDDVLTVFIALGAVLSREIEILKPPPTADIQTEHEFEVVALLDSLVHHLRERRSVFGIQFRSAMVGKLANDLHAMLLRPQ